MFVNFSLLTVTLESYNKHNKNKHSEVKIIALNKLTLSHKLNFIIYN